MAHLDRHSDTYYRLSMEKLAITLVNWRKVNTMPPVGNRILSIAEAASLTGLNGKFQFFGTLNDKQQQLGNAVTQAIASFVKSIVKMRCIVLRTTGCKFHYNFGKTGSILTLFFLCFTILYIETYN